MPPTGPENALFFAERLKVPWSWWVIAVIGVGVGGAEVFAGFDWRVALVVYLVLGVPTLVFLVGLGRTRICVDRGGLHAGGRTLPPDEVADVHPLDARQTRHMLGPGGHPSGNVVGRGYVKTSVIVRTHGAGGTPYWLVTTRHPAELAAALERALAVNA
jgi:hypothetical protein